MTSYVERFDRHQIVQHFVLLLSFVLLAVSGFVLAFEFGWGKPVIEWAGGRQVIRSVHLWAAVWMIGSGVYHLLWAAVKRPTSMVPRVQDFKDFGRDMAYTVGRAKAPAEYEKFSYMHKFEYWGAFWGFVVMIGTGLLMWYPSLLQGAPEWVAAARVAHADEAVLAVVFIATWHMYASHFRVRFFPFNPVVFTGKFPLKHVREEHSRWSESADLEEGE